MSNGNADGTPTRPSTSVSSSVSGGTPLPAPRQSLLPTPDTSTMIIDDLAYDSGSDDEMSIEAKRVLRRKKLEREKLQKLGTFILTLSFTVIVSPFNEGPSSLSTHSMLSFRHFHPEDIPKHRINYDKES